MQNRIDAHVHITPLGMVGKIDPVSGSEILANGKVKLRTGFVCPVMPPYMGDSAFTADELIALMDEQGISKAVILQSSMFDKNQYVADAVNKYPGRLKGGMILDVADGACYKKIAFWKSRGLSVLKFEMNSLQTLNPEFTFSSELFAEIAGECEKQGVVISVDTGPVGGPSYDISALEKTAEEHKNLKLVICHLGFPRQGIYEDEKQYNLWRRMIELGRHGNVYFDAAAMPDFFDGEGYPFPTALKLTREFADLCGAEKLMWGSDVPGTLSRATYPQQFRMFDESGLFSQDELNMFYYANAEKLFF